MKIKVTMTLFENSIEEPAIAMVMVTEALGEARGPFEAAGLTVGAISIELEEDEI